MAMHVRPVIRGFDTATWFCGLVLVYYYTGICDATVTKWNFQIRLLVLPFKKQVKLRLTISSRVISQVIFQKF